MSVQRLDRRGRWPNRDRGTGNSPDARNAGPLSGGSDDDGRPRRVPLAGRAAARPPRGPVADGQVGRCDGCIAASERRMSEPLSLDPNDGHSPDKAASSGLCPRWGATLDPSGADSPRQGRGHAGDWASGG